MASNPSTLLQAQLQASLLAGIEPEALAALEVLIPTGYGLNCEAETRAAFELLGALNPRFKEQTANFLEAMGIGDEATFREVLKEAHDSMRRDAEAERGAAA